MYEAQPPANSNGANIQPVAKAELKQVNISLLQIKNVSDLIKSNCNLYSEFCVLNKRIHTDS